MTHHTTEQQFAIYITRDIDGCVSIHLERPEMVAGYWASGTQTTDLARAIIGQFGEGAAYGRPVKLTVTIKEQPTSK